MNIPQPLHDMGILKRLEFGMYSSTSCWTNTSRMLTSAYSGEVKVRRRGVASMISNSSLRLSQGLSRGECDMPTTV